MNQEYPFIRATTPDRTQYQINFETIIDLQSPIKIRIGRLNKNHIVLSDPQNNISRHHCSIQYQSDRWWIVDEDSSNGTFLRRESDRSKIDLRLEDKIALRSGDCILIFGKLDAAKQPIFWELEFIDPSETVQVFEVKKACNLEYSLSQQTLYRHFDRRQDAISLTNLEHALIDYMSRRNYQNNNRVTVCEYDELISAVWNDDSFGKDSGNINRLAWQIRKKIELNSDRPRFLKTITGVGCSLKIDITA